MTQFVCSLLCAHQLLQNNSSAKPSNVHGGSGEVTVRFLLGHVRNPIHRLFLTVENCNGGELPPTPPFF